MNPSIPAKRRTARRRIPIQAQRRQAPTAVVGAASKRLAEQATKNPQAYVLLDAAAIGLHHQRRRPGR
jgi:hypothetical protein